MCKRATNLFRVDQMIQQIQEIEINDDDILSLYILNSVWNNINKGLIAAVNDLSILLDKLNITEEKYNKFAKGITDGTACIVSDESFNPNTPIDLTRISTIILIPTDTSEKAQCVTEVNWITGKKEINWHTEAN